MAKKKTKNQPRSRKNSRKNFFWFMIIISFIMGVGVGIYKDFFIEKCKVLIFPPENKKEELKIEIKKIEKKIRKLKEKLEEKKLQLLLLDNSK